LKFNKEENVIDRYAMLKKFIFPNNLELYSFQAPDVSFETIGFIVYAGYRQDPDGKEGLAHFVEHLVGDNCSLSSDEIEDFFRRQGGDYNRGETDVLKTAYRFSMLADEPALHQAFSIFSRMLISSDLKEQEKERRRVSNEIIRVHGSETDHEIFAASMKAVCSWHPFFGKAIKGVGTDRKSVV
jgi:insulysin